MSVTKAKKKRAKQQPPLKVDKTFGELMDLASRYDSKKKRLKPKS